MSAPKHYGSVIEEENKDLRLQLLSTQAAIEKHNKQCVFVSSSPIEVDLSILHQHDDEIRKPLVNVLKGIRIALEVYGGFERTIKNIDAALATIKDL